MKFPVNKCMSCGLDLTTAEPAEVKYVGEGEVGTCPQCLTPYFMVEDNALPLDPPPEPAPEAEPAPPRARARRAAPATEPTEPPEPPAEPPEPGEAEPGPEE